MSTTKKAPAETTPNRKPLAEYKDSKVTPLIQEFAEWLSRETGYEVDPLSVFLGSALRTRFQQERREAKAAAKPKRAPRRPVAPKADA